MAERVYLDWNATAPLRAEARAAMIAAMDVVGNPSSVHAEGRAAKALVERARADLAEVFGADGADVVFTSGATEAAALALSGGGGASANFPSPIEHDAVFSWFNCTDGVGPGLLEDWVFDPSGALISQFGEGLFELAIEDGQILSVGAANSETGILTDTAEFGREAFAGAGRHRLFVDATQAFGKIPFAFNWSGADMAICSAHKIGGPKGVGALFLRQGVDIPPLVKGGGQEMGRRSGTENVIGIVGFAAAAKAAMADLEAGVWERVAELRNILEKALATSANKTIFVGHSAARLPNTSCLAAPGWKGETQVMAMDLAGFAISAGSACSSGKVRPSRVLRAMGYDEETARSSIRVSLGPTTTEDQIMRFADIWRAQYDKFQARAA